ncbi:MULTISPECIES: reverse transcriptase family protein [Pseudomonas chlororaphis group]|uniref:reverse transcriptase family protein n=1 Tax=Pseudomonas chlororaphis group TaxID=136842 RepID=UPI0009C00658|nr:MULTISPECIES: reverse transcriptase family protein [Pseudomonas chlororaphis group]MCO7573416.1 reverse transcriptase family protein [Pseudomonas chlororaphis]MCO7591190.1 reverse transcriptase family protein [Pseudomonas chlororaphis]
MTKSVKDWLKHFERRGISRDLVESYLPYIKKLNQTSSPVIFEFEHLSLLIGVDQHELRKMVNAPHAFYHSFQIKKRSGGMRKIHAPYPSMLMCQDWIYKNVLINKPVHSAAHGFVPGRSIFTNASVHLGSKCLMKMDLKDFFPSVPINWVINYFLSLGYADNVSFYLGALCCCEGRLVQGSATSPYLTNILLKGLDERISLLAKAYGLRFTRYADDLTFSGNYIPHKLIGVVSEIIVQYGLRVNDKKTKLQVGANQKIVTGLSVSGNALALPRKFKRELKMELHFIKKYGYVSHASKKKIRNPYYIDSVIGKLNFWLQVEPANMEALSGLELMRGIQLGHVSSLQSHV